MIETAFFFLFAVVAVISAILVVTLRNPVHSVASLIVCFFQVACLFVLLRSPFLAGAQLFVYVGAIMIFFLFAVFLLDLQSTMGRERFSRLAVYGIPAGIVLFIEGGLLINLWHFGKPVKEDEAIAKLLSLGESTEAIGAVLFTKFVYPFEIISVVLLVAFVGAVVLTMRGRKEAK